MTTEQRPALLLRKAGEAAAIELPDSISKRLASQIETMLGDLAGCPLSIAPGAVSNMRFAEWRMAQNPFAMAFRYRHPSLGEALLHIPGALLGQIVDLHYGGDGKPLPKTGFSKAERRFADRLGERVGSALQSLREATPSEPIEYVGLVDDLLQASASGARDAVVVQTLTAESPAFKPTIVSLILSGPLAQELAAQTDDVSRNGRSRRAIHSAAMRIRMPARAELAQIDLPLNRLLALAPGDILPVILPGRVPLTVGGRIFARGTIGEADGRAAIMIETIEKELDQ